MERKDHIDLFGGSVLVIFAMVMGLNQVVIKVVNDGMQPVFQAGLRSLFAFFVVWGWALWRGKRISVTDGTFGWSADGAACSRLSSFFSSWPWT